MAKEWWESAPLASEVAQPEEQPKKKAEWWESAPLAEGQKTPTKGEWWESAPLAQGQKAEPTESGGFLGSAATTLEQTVKSFKPAFQQYLNIGDQKAAAEEQLKYREESNNAYKQTEFSEIGDAFKSGDVSGAIGKLIDKTKEVAGSSLGAMAPAIAAAQVGTAVGGPVAGTLAFGITGFATYVADYIGRQKEEQKKQGREGEDRKSTRLNSSHT